MRSLLTLCLILLAAVPAKSAPPEPDYLRDLDRPYHAGDWTLQCNGSRFCQIIGVVKIPRDETAIRAIIMINRGRAKDATPSLRIAFVDPMGAIDASRPVKDARLYARGLPKMPPPIRLELGRIETDGAYSASADVAAKIIHALQKWPGSVVHNRGRKIATMPKGNLARLFRKMDRLQHPIKPRMTPQETAQWLKEYHYVIFKSAPYEGSIPESVLLSCDTRTYVNRPFAVRVAPDKILYTAECPEGTKVFLQNAGEEPIVFEVTDSERKIQRHGYAGYNTDTSLLEIQLPKNGNEGCGIWMKVGHTGREFAMIEDRRYDRCRAVPYAFWPKLWYPTSWKYADIPPTNEGNAPPAGEGVKAP
jgi:hypothetical protein